MRHVTRHSRSLNCSWQHWTLMCQSSNNGTTDWFGLPMPIFEQPWCTTDWFGLLMPIHLPTTRSTGLVWITYANLSIGSSTSLLRSWSTYFHANLVHHTILIIMSTVSKQYQLNFSCLQYFSLFLFVIRRNLEELVFPIWIIQVYAYYLASFFEPL